MRVFVEGIGLLGPGLGGWRDGREILAGRQAYVDAATVVPPPELLPAAERRRAGMPVKLALAVGREAFLDAGCDPAITAVVFTSSSGDGEILDRMCKALATPEREVSPTHFMNSVHNVAAGYWSIATQCREASTSLCVYNASFTAGLLEAAVQVAVDRKPVGLIAHDQPYPEPLHTARPIKDKFAVAMIFAPAASRRSLATLELHLAADARGETHMPQPELEKVRGSIPAARSLPLLLALARGVRDDLVLPYLDGCALTVTVAPC